MSLLRLSLSVSLAGFGCSSEVGATGAAPLGAGPGRAGERTCSETVGCILAAAGDPADAERCLDTSPGSAGAFGAVAACMEWACEGCTGTPCDECVASACGDELEACLQAEGHEGRGDALQ
jgi:hypothetical protein